jgi:hypothetical protein
MTRISKQAERRMKCPRRPSVAGKKTGPRAQKGFRKAVNSINGQLSSEVFIGKVK